jgi:type IV pilus assembly protein PilQ
MRAPLAPAIIVLIGAMLAAPPRARAGSDPCRPGAKHRGAPVDLDVKDADLHDVMRLLADVGGINLVIASDVRGKVTLRVKRVAWDLAACTVTRVHRLAITHERGIWLVRKR